MDVAGSAVGIASLGIQVCQGLLSYYDAWKSFNSDISSTYDLIDDLSRTLALLKSSLDSDLLDEEKKDRVERCLQSCEASIVKLSQKSQKLRKDGQPEGFREKTWSELQRGWYPFRAGTLVKLRDIVGDMRERLKLAVQVLHLDVSTTSQRILKSVATGTSDLVIRTAAIETHISAQNQQILALQQSDQFKKIKTWLQPPDPWTNHMAARQRHEPNTGTWLLQADQYQKWKAGDIRHLWLYGKAGCGKTVLCSTVIEDVQDYCHNGTNTMCAAFYFTFSDSQKQSYKDLLQSLVAQLGWKEPGLSMLTQAYERSKARIPAVDELEKILLACVQSYNELFLVLDAVDECPEGSEVRQDVLEGLERLAHKAGNIRMFVTSRESGDIGDSMQALGANSTSVAAQSVDADIQRYTTSQLSRDRKLNKLDRSTKKLIGDTISQRAGGMFRWAYCHLQELKKLKSTRPSFIKDVLLDFPSTLDETYERILIRIDQRLRKEATLLLQWLAYARTPPTLSELAEASIVDPAGEGSVQVGDRGGLQDTLEILGELVTCGNADDKGDNGDDNDEDDVDSYEYDYDDVDDEESENNSEDEVPNIYNKSATWCGRKIGRGSRVRFAHFSVKEYLESKRIVQSSAKDFYLEIGVGHRFLAQSCLTYLMHYSNSEEKTLTRQDLAAFPMLKRAATSWSYHSLQQQSKEVSREVELLYNKKAKVNWLSVWQPDNSKHNLFLEIVEEGSSVYYASFLGLTAVVSELLRAGCDATFQGGILGNALQAASLEGWNEVLEMLLDAGAEINAPGGVYGNSLQAASSGGHEELVKILIQRGANVNAQGGQFGNALQAASYSGNQKVVKMLLDIDADVNAVGGQYGYAIQAASERGRIEIVKMLLDAGAKVNTRGASYGTALHAAAYRGEEELMRVLIEYGANVNAQGGWYGNALQAASSQGRWKAVKILIDAGADVNAEGGEYCYALHTASLKGHEKVVQMLIAAGSNVNALGPFYGNALHAASRGGHDKIVQMLINEGADVNAVGGQYGNALQEAAFWNRVRVMQVLMEQGANIHAQGGPRGNALQTAALNSSARAVEMLLNAGVDVNVQGGVYGTALQAALHKGWNKRVINMLLDAQANVNAQGGIYGNALQAASAEGYEEVVTLLLDRGADINAHGGQHGTALGAASWRGHKEVVAMLIARGAREGHSSTAS